jgi:phospholipase C
LRSSRAVVLAEVGDRLVIRGKPTQQPQDLDITSGLSLTRRFELPTLRGITLRDQAIASTNQAPLGDLTSALDLSLGR